MKAPLATALAALILTACAARHQLLTVYPELQAVPENEWCEARGGLPREVPEPAGNGQLKIKVVGCDILPHTSDDDQRRNIRRWLTARR